MGQHHLYDLGADPDEGENRRGETTEAEMADLLRTALVEVEAPAEQLRAAGAGVTDAAKRIADQALEYVFDPPVASDRVIDYASPERADRRSSQPRLVWGSMLDQQPVSPDQLVDAVQTIVDRSMHTTHPRFFNQNFAGPEPIAVVGDWLAAALNTTNATFEVAPVFTMMERAVINKMAGLGGLPGRPWGGSARRQASSVLAARRRRCTRCNWHGTEPVPTFCRRERLGNGWSCSCRRPRTTPRSSQPR